MESNRDAGQETNQEINQETNQAPNRETLDPRITKLVIWGVMVSALLTYLIIAYVAAYAPDKTKEITGKLIELRTILMSLMVVSFLLGLVFPKIAPQLAKSKTDTNGFAMLIIQLSFLEVTALSGFFFTMLSFHIVYSVLGGGLGLLGMAILYPRRAASGSP